MPSFFLSKLKRGYIWRRILLERLTEPLHLNLLALFVALAGSFRAKVAFDLVLRQYHAFSLLKAADFAKENGIDRITAIEFGVANGAGLINLCKLAERITRVTGVRIDVAGFDTGKGMPAPRDYRDHPEYYRRDDYPMQDQAELRRHLPGHCRLVIGDVKDTVGEFLRECAHPIGFVSVDVDYYWSSAEALRIFGGPAAKYLPLVVVYLDDVEYDGHSSFAGEQLAVEDFNRQNASRKIARFGFLREKRVFQRATWINHIYLAHIFDHPSRERALGVSGATVLDNPYLSAKAK